MLKTDAQSELKAYTIFTLHTKHTKIRNKNKIQFDLYYL